MHGRTGAVIINIFFLDGVTFVFFFWEHFYKEKITSNDPSNLTFQWNAIFLGHTVFEFERTKSRLEIKIKITMKNEKLREYVAKCRRMSEEAYA